MSSAPDKIRRALVGKNPLVHDHTRILYRLVSTDVRAFAYASFAILPATVLIALLLLFYFEGPPLRTGELQKLVLMIATLCIGFFLMGAIPLTIRLLKLRRILSDHVVVTGVLTSLNAPNIGSLLPCYTYSIAAKEHSSHWYIWKTKLAAKLENGQKVTVMAHRTKPNQALLAEPLGLALDVPVIEKEASCDPRPHSPYAN